MVVIIYERAFSDTPSLCYIDQATDCVRVRNIITKMNIDTERVITEVGLHPPLWDISCELYKDRDAKIKAWVEVCQAVQPDYDYLSDSEKKGIERQVQQRWKTARDAYVRCKAQNRKSGSGGGIKKKYLYFDYMQFLDKKQVVEKDDAILENQKINNDSQSNSGTAAIATEEGEINEDELSLALHFMARSSKASQSNQTATTIPSECENVQRKRKKNPDEDEHFEREMLNSFRETTRLMQNDDMSFFCSLLPITKTFSIQQKLHFRLEVLKTAMDISRDNSSGEDRSGEDHSGEDRPGTSRSSSTS